MTSRRTPTPPRAAVRDLAGPGASVLLAGGDGSGRSMQAGRPAETLPAEGHDLVRTRPAAGVAA